MENAPFSNQGLDPDQLEKEERLVYRSICSVEDAIKEINFVALKEIVFSLFKRIYSPLSKEEFFNHIEEDNLFSVRVKYTELLGLSNYGSRFDYQNQHTGAYNAPTGNVVFAREMVDEEGLMNEEKKLHLIKVIIHEIIHSLSRDGNKIGLTVTDELQDEQNNLEEGGFVRLNEGLTEVIADAIYSEYFARVGSASHSYESKELLERYAVYIPERLALAALVDKICAYSGLSSDRVYQALTIEYFTNGDMLRADIVSECKDEDVLLFLEKIKRNDDNLFPEFDAAYENEILTFLEKREMSFVRGLVGRDYIGETNKRKVLRSN